MQENKPNISVSIDWISATFPLNTPNKLILPMCLSSELPLRVKSPIPVYPDCMQYGDVGIKILSGAGDRLGKHVIISGKPLNKLREMDKNALTEIYGNIIDNKGKVSRIDIAIDLFNSVISPQTIHERLTAGLAQTELEGSFHMGKHDKVETLYIGDWKSNKRKLRVYDKAIEQGLPDLIWTRIEYERRQKAHNLAREIFEKKKDMIGIVRGVLDFPTWKEWKELLSSGPIAITRNEAKEDNQYNSRLDWINNSAAKAIARNVYDDYTLHGQSFEDSATLILLSNAIHRELNRLIDAKITNDI